MNLNEIHHPGRYMADDTTPHDLLWVTPIVLLIGWALIIAVIIGVYNVL